MNFIKDMMTSFKPLTVEEGEDSMLRLSFYLEISGQQCNITVSMQAEDNKAIDSKVTRAII